MPEADAKSLKLTVAEALTKDVGRGIARMDPNDMASAGLKVGDVVHVSGKRATSARVMPTYAEERGKGVIQLDGIIRDNSQAGLGEHVRIQKVEFEQASSIVLEPVTHTKAFISGKDTRYLSRVLEGLPVTQGDRIRASLFGSRYREFTVAYSNPGGVVLIGPRTAVEVKGDGAQSRARSGVTYEDIGALRKELRQIREMIELPLRHPELFERLGIEAPRGVLLHGPPGCGKTLIARAVANETDASFFHIGGPEVIHKFYGESEAHLRAMFDKARSNAPSIVFIDEIDAIAAKREDIRGDQQVERRVVAQLLSLMDGLESRGQVIVIGATNIPQVLDPALRRPGRFDREIAISVPDRNGRLEILHVHTRGMPLGSDVDLDRLAEITHGFVGADMESLCREAAMATLRKIMPYLQLDSAYVPDDLLYELEITMDDFMEAFKDVEPSAIREVFTEIPNVSWEDVGGLEDVKRTLIESVEWPLRYPELFSRAKTSPPKGILLTGPPGTGKTLLAKAVANQSGVNFISVKGPALMSKWIGESEKGIREVFKRARQASPCIVFFDEIDSIAPARAMESGSHVTERVISQFLTELDGLEELKGVMVLASTNRPDIIDPALLRAGRFDIQVELPVPDQKARAQIFSIHTSGKPLAANVDLDRLVEATEGLVGSDIEAICRRASILAIREFIGDSAAAPVVPDAHSDISKLKIAHEHFEQSIQDISRRP